MAANECSPAADTRALKADIDRLVYALGGLTDDEITIVEGLVHKDVRREHKTRL